MLPTGFDGTVSELRIPVTIRWPAVSHVAVRGSANALFVGTTVTHDAVAFHGDGTRRPAAEVSWMSSAPAVASVDAYGSVTAHGAGPVTITASVEDVTEDVAYTVVPDDSIVAPGAPAIMDEGSFVAEVPGRYTIIAMSGPLTERRTVRVTPREVVQRIALQGQGAVQDVHTSDLWVFEGLDRRDYAITGTWGADGWAYICSRSREATSTSSST